MEASQDKDQIISDLRSENAGLRRYIAACEPFITTADQRAAQEAASKARLDGEEAGT